MASPAADPTLDLYELLGKPLAITTRDGRLFVGMSNLDILGSITPYSVFRKLLYKAAGPAAGECSRSISGCFHCTDSQMNIILTDTEEFPPAPKDESEIKRRDWEEVWLPRSQRMDGDPNWLHIANPSSSAQASSTTNAPDLRLEPSLGIALDRPIRHERLDGSQDHGDGLEVGRERSGHGDAHTDEANEELEARHLERAESDGSTTSTSDTQSPSHASQSQAPAPEAKLEGWKWGYGRGPGRYTGMVLVPGHHIDKVELVHGDW